MGGDMADIVQASRPIMWNVGGAFVMYAMFFAALAVFAYGVHLRLRSWRKGRPDDDRLSHFSLRAWLTLKELLLQKRVRIFPYPGLFHSLIFYAFAVLALSTLVVALDYDLGTVFFRGWVYAVLTVGCELAGVAILIGAGMAFYRRYLARPPSLERKPADAVALALLLVLVVTGFLVEGLRLAAAADRWYYLSPVGYAASLPFAGLPRHRVLSLHRWLWWLHTAVGMCWIASIPYTKFSHIITLPANTFFQKLRPRGELRRDDLEAIMNDPDADLDALSIGLRTPEEFTWKQRLDLDACVDCGRCEQVCPSVMAGSQFSPRTLISRCRDLVRSGPGASTVAAPAESPEQERPEVTIVGSALTDDFIWRCRTCMACMAVCPAFIDHVDTLVEIRRNQVMMQGSIPRDAGYALKLLEAHGNPFGPQDDRLSWIDRAGLRVVEPNESCEVIYWIGCCTTFDPANQKIAEDLCSVLDLCDIDYGILGPDEHCCGDPARLLGDERLFQQIAREQIERISSRKFAVLLTSCPHCYNVLKNEYRQMGGNFNVMHHSEFLHELIWRRGIVPRFVRRRRVAYHDPCYLGRYQKIYDSPREVIRAMPGCEMVELDSNRGLSLCCGGGGGHFWMDLKEEKRVNRLRIEQVIRTRADTVVTACAYCKRMLDDGIKMLDLDDRVEVVDIATLVVNSLALEYRGKDATACFVDGDEERKLQELVEELQAVARSKVTSG
jgi:Fe-S oxidoreductase/nitrate reductase gamma subunit